MFYYWGFGLHIHSELEFPELVPEFPREPDLGIKLAAVHLPGDAPAVGGNYERILPAEYFLRLEGVANYYASNGKLLVIDPAPGADQESVRLYALCSAMAAILHQRSKIPFHASAIVSGDGLVLFTGQCGAGKSTTAFGLKQRGYQVFSDDVCVLERTASGQVLATASYPVIKLWENSIAKLASQERNRIEHYRIRPSQDKYGFFQHDTFDTRSLLVCKIVILTTSAGGNAFSCSLLEKPWALTGLRMHTYRNKHVEEMGLQGIQFLLLSSLTVQADVYRVSRPAEGTDISSFLEFIERQVLKRD